jgi:hypothetical protein
MEFIFLDPPIVLLAAGRQKQGEEVVFQILY